MKYQYLLKEEEREEFEEERSSQPADTPSYSFQVTAKSHQKKKPAVLQQTDTANQDDKEPDTELSQKDEAEDGTAEETEETSLEETKETRLTEERSLEARDNLNKVQAEFEVTEQSRKATPFELQKTKARAKAKNWQAIIRPVEIGENPPALEHTTSGEVQSRGAQEQRKSWKEQVEAEVSRIRETIFNENLTDDQSPAAMKSASPSGQQSNKAEPSLLRVRLSDRPVLTRSSTLWNEPLLRERLEI